MSRAAASPRVLATHVAEWVSPGHPDRLADAIAERIVRHALAADPSALVGVAAAVHRHRVFVDGHVAAHGLEPVSRWLPGLVRATYAAAGYGEVWAPHPDRLQIADDLLVETPPARPSDAPTVACDQSVTTGWAGRDARTAFLPPAQFLAAALGQALVAWRASEAAAELGPDCKLLPHLEELADGSFRWRRLTVSIQHRPGLGYEALHRLLLPVLRAALAVHERAGLRGVADSFVPSVLHANGAGAFEAGGPLADNGLTGKKLVVDHYGPDVPIGGGAVYGKDPRKVDRIGSVRARQWALALLGPDACEARTRLTWSPGDAAPALVEGWTRDQAGTWSPVPQAQVPDPTWFEIDRAVRELGAEGGAGFDPPGAFAAPLVR